VFTSAMQAQAAADPRVTAVTPVQVLSALVSTGEAGAPVVIKGGAYQDLDAIYKLSDSLVAGQATLAGDGILLGKELVEEYGLAPGDRVDLVLADGSQVKATLEGVFDLGSAAANEKSAFVEMQITDVFASGEVAADVAATFPQAKIVDWQQTNGDLLTALQSQSSSSYMIQVFVIIAVMLGIASTLAISAVQKTKQIGILKALGMSDSRTGLVFLYQAGVLGVLGTVLGIIISLVLIFVFSRFATFVMEPRLGFVLISAGIGIAVALISAIIPYRKTARLDPIEVIQGA
jgi:lipoprotein-releasing system permease protein